MRRPTEIAAEEQTMNTLVQLTSIFESIASLRIAQIKNQVKSSENFFEELWQIYTQLRRGAAFNFGRGDDASKLQKDLFIIVTSEGAFSGDIDEKLIEWMLKTYDDKKHDIIVIGHHGAVQLSELGIPFKKYYKLPAKDQNINVTPIVQYMQKYHNTWVYYQTYVSLMVQDVKRINLSSAVEDQGRDAKAAAEAISEDNYIFEPSTFDVVDHLERSMLHIALSQVILESKLAQFASRFRAMSAAHQKAEESQGDLKIVLSRAKRAVKDERLKEIVNGLKKAHAL